MSVTDPNAIVTVNVSTILAPFPSDFQQSGAIVTFGGTNQPTGSTTVLTLFEDLVDILSEPMAVDTAVWEAADPGGTPPVPEAIVTITTVNPLPQSIVQTGTLYAQLSGFVPAAYNGAFTCTVTGPSEFTYPLVADPGVTTVIGQVQLQEAAELNSQVSTFYAQGSQVEVTILELGYKSLFAEKVSALEDWLNLNLLTYYGYLLPYEFGSATNIPLGLPLFEHFENPEAMTYFWLTLNDPTCIGLIPPTCKSIIQLLEAPTVAPTRDQTLPGDYSEFTIAAMFYWAMQFRATSVTRVAPMCFKYLYAVTPYPTQSNGPLLLSLKQNFVNYVQTGAEGGIAFTNVYQGVTADGFDYFNWWWTIDWVQININLDLSNCIINGSNNPLAPLYYDQQGINVLEAQLASTMMDAGSFGMVNGPVIQTQYDSPSLQLQIQLGTFGGQCNVNAVPFIPYSIVNPSDYGRGEYDGLSTLFIPARGFVHILVQVTATDIVTV